MRAIISRGLYIFLIPFFNAVVLSGNYEILAICTDKNTFLMTLIIKLTLGNIFIKVKNPPGGATVTK